MPIPDPPQPSAEVTSSEEQGSDPVKGDDSNTDQINEKKGFFSRFSKKKKEEDTEEDQKPPPVKFHQLFRHATRLDIFYMVISCVSAAIHGSLMPIFAILFGRIINDFGDLGSSNFTEEERKRMLEDITNRIGQDSKWFLILAVIAFISSFIQVRFQLIVAQRICARLRGLYFQSLMSQDYSWYDQNNGGELTARVAGDVNLIQLGIGDKFSAAIQFLSMFFVGVIIAFVFGPLLTLVVLSVAPLLILGGAILGKLAADSTGDQLGAYGEAGSIASEAIGLIRIVTAYNGQEHEAKRYEVKLDRAYEAEAKKSVYTGLGIGFTMFVIFCAYGVAFRFGANRVSATPPAMAPGDILTTFFSILIACMSLGQASPSFQAIITAQGAAPRLYEVIDRESEINPLDEEDGTVIPDFKGDISFRNVDFNYQNRVVDDTKDDGEDQRPFVLTKFNLHIPPGSSHALVGESGCGKSTTVRLIERFYDVENGNVNLDGTDVRTLNVKWLRSQMGYVGQMPTLFALSIKDNIALGAAMVASVDETSGKTVMTRKQVTDDDIINAAKQANAHNFIMKLPEQYNTMLGERGALLSGGQKQRVCIARALIRNPKILILDESTAALDSQSERVVQEALEKASAGRTTITIAHRLSTIKNADVISVIDKGLIVEAGKHSELLHIEDGAYRTLVEHQNVEAENINAIKEAKGTESTGLAMDAQVFTKSVTKTIDGAAQGENIEKDDDVDVDKGVYMRAILFNRQEWFYILLGLIGAAMAGAAFPVMAIIFSDVIVVLFETSSSSFDSDVTRYALFFVAIGAGSFIGNILQMSCLGISGEKLTWRLRRAGFRAILRQDMAFFDKKENSLGALTTRLATEASMVRGITGDTLGTLMFCASTVITGFAVAYIGCWRAALVVTAIFPLMGVAGALQMKLMAGFDAHAEKRYANAGTVAAEAVDNYGTVTSLGVQDVFMARYNEELEGPLVSGRKSALVAGLAFGLSEFLGQALWAISFWVGSIFVRNEQCDFRGLMKAITGLLFAGMMVGQISSFMPDVAKSRLAATKIFRLLDLQPAIDPTLRSDTKPPVSGNVAMEEVCFEYPTRADVPVLRGISVNVVHGQTLALVGASGCGKSTIVALLERFYDPRSGTIRIDETEIPNYDLQWIRQHFGLVSQEPDLFNCSIRDNIAYGLSQEDGTPITDEMIIEAAKEANAHNFISELDEKYDTVVGPRGDRLSGGQRQRVAIARAVVRKPRLLLLDEATSALDAVSERVVQDALEKASTGRTTIAIAHRLSTVKDADAIAVVSRGKIVELGTHDQLLRIENGEYANLIKNQLTDGNEVNDALS